MDEAATSRVGTGEPFVSVIIPVLNDTDRLHRCLEALANQALPANRFEILIVDNGSSPPVHIRDCAPNVIVIRDERPGSYAARNAGATIARGDVLAFTDSDCVPDSDWLTAALERFHQDPACQAIAGEVEVHPHDPGRPNLVELYEMAFGFPQRHYAESLGFGVTANLLVRRDSFTRVGPFDPSLPSGGDAEWGRRAARGGVRVRYAPEVRVAHPARSTWRQLRAKGRRVAYGEYLLLKDGRASRTGYWVRWLTPPLVKAIHSAGRQPGSVSRRMSVAAMMIGLHYLHAYEIALWHLRTLVMGPPDATAPPVR